MPTRSSFSPKCGPLPSPSSRSLLPCPLRVATSRLKMTPFRNVSEGRCRSWPVSSKTRGQIHRNSTSGAAGSSVITDNETLHCLFKGLPSVQKLPSSWTILNRLILERRIGIPRLILSKFVCIRWPCRSRQSGGNLSQVIGSFAAFLYFRVPTYKSVLVFMKALGS